MARINNVKDQTDYSDVQVGDTIEIRFQTYVVVDISEQRDLPNVRRAMDAFGYRDRLYLRKPRGKNLFEAYRTEEGRILALTAIPG